MALAALLLPAQQGGRGGAQAPAGIPSIEERTGGMRKIDGYFPLYWDERTGSLWLEIPRLDTDFLYATGLAAGLGSNDIGLDRGQEGGGSIVSFERVGPKILLVQGNENLPLLQPQPRRAPLGGGFLRQVRALGLHRGRRIERPRAGGCHRFLRARRPRRRRLAWAPAYRVDRTRSAVYTAAHQGVPQEHRNRSDPDLRQ